MKKILLAAMCVLMLGGCSALPAEERSFAVALGIAANADVWEVTARIPAYKTDGDYLTISAQGKNLQEALIMLDAASPMRMHYGQVRLIVFSQDTAASEKFMPALSMLAERADMRLQAQVCVTEDELRAFMDALEPQTGNRLSKSLDTLLETRRTLGVIPDASLSAIMRMGERQCPVLLAAALAGDAQSKEIGMDAAAGEQALQGGSEIQLGGGYLADGYGVVQGELSAEEVQLLSLMHNSLQRSALVLGGDTVMLSESSAKATLDGMNASCVVQVKYSASSLAKDAVEHKLEAALQALADKLAASDCDALGLGRYAVRHFADMDAWHELDWPRAYQQVSWSFSVEAEPPA